MVLLISRWHRARNLLSYTKANGRKNLTLVPTLSYVSTGPLLKVLIKSRMDKVYSSGLSANYAFTEWLSLAGLSNFSWKRTSGTDEEDDLLSFDDFIGGVTLSVNHAF